MRKGLLLAVLLIIIPSELLAGIYDPTFNDKSVELLGKIFGQGIGNVTLGGDPSPILSDIFSILNQIIITVGVVIVSYVAIVSTINTAREGTAMGRKWSSIWIPMRSVMGMMLMVPGPNTGYSLIQTLVMWVILQGIGAADRIWETVLDNLSKGITLSLSLGTSSNTSGIKQSAKNITQYYLNTLVCRKTIAAIANDNELCGINGSYAGSQICQDGSQIQAITTPLSDSGMQFNSSGQASEYSVNQSIIFGIPDANAAALSRQVCGKFRIQGVAKRSYYNDNSKPNVNEATLRELANTTLQTKLEALTALDAILSPLADYIVAGQVTPRVKVADGDQLDSLADDQWKYYYDASGEAAPSPGGYKQIAEIAYTDTMKGLIIPENSSEILGEKSISKAKEFGWVSAASFYFILNKFSQLTISPNAGAMPTTENMPINETVVDKPTNLGKGLTEFAIPNDNDEVGLILLKKLNESIHYLNNDTLKTKISGPLTIDTSHYNIPSAGGGVFRKLFKDFFESTSEVTGIVIKSFDSYDPNGDPILQSVAFGQDMMNYCEFAWVFFIASLLVISIGTFGTCMNPFFSGFFTLVFTLGTMAMIVLGLVWSFGAMLGIYLPLVPYMMFIIGVLAWLLLVVEAIVAAPILALALVHPSSDEIGKLAAGLILLANIFLRPGLMIFGFLLAIKVYQAIVYLVNWSILSNLKFIASSLFAFIPAIGIYTGFIMALTNKCFSLIYGIPDRVLRWMGSQAMATDSSQEISASKASAETGAKRGATFQASTGEGIGKQVKDKVVDPNRSRADDGGGGGGGGGGAGGHKKGG